MITYQGQRYDVTYVGDVEIREVAGATLSVDAWGLDQCVRKYKGALTKLPAFIAGLRRSRIVADPQYRGLTLASYNATENGPWAEIDVTCKGTFDGNLPAPLPSASSLSPETVTLGQAVDSAAQSSGGAADSADAPTVQLAYLAPSTTWRYIARKRPTAPQFRGALEGSQEIQIISRRGGYGKLNIFAGGNLGDPIDVEGRQVGDYNGVAMTVTKSFSVAPAGIFFECEETNQRTIFPLDLAQIHWNLTL